VVNHKKIRVLPALHQNALAFFAKALITGGSNFVDQINVEVDPTI